MLILEICTKWRIGETSMRVLGHNTPVALNKKSKVFNITTFVAYVKLVYALLFALCLARTGRRKINKTDVFTDDSLDFVNG